MTVPSRAASVVLEPFDAANRPVVEHLWQLYKHDMSEVVGSLPGADGRFRSGRLPRYFAGGSDAGFLIRSGNDPIGFCSVLGVGDRSSVMGDFFVVRAARRDGVGSAVAARLLVSRPGSWSVPFQAANAKAAEFWRGVANAAAGTGWTEELTPVPGRPEVPPDVWLRFTIRPAAQAQP